MTETHKIAKAASIVSGSTLLSRVAGLFRDQVTAYFFGTSLIADAFFMAFRLPNLLRRLLAEGALTVAFVPVFTNVKEQKGDQAAAELFQKMLGLMIIVLGLVTILGVIFTPQIISLMAYGFLKDPEKFRLTVFLARLLFPYIFFMGLCALFMGALNSSGRFAAPALGPFVCNISMITATVLLSPRLEQPIIGLVIGTIVGGILQLAIQIPSLYKVGLKLKINWKIKDESIKKILILMGPAALGAAVYQLSVFINSILASKLPEGSVSLLYYADRLMQFPLGIFTMAIGSAALPALARQSALGDEKGFTDSALFALRISFFITIPAAAGLAVMSEPLIRFLYERGSFNYSSAVGTAEALRAFCLGLPFLSGAGIMARIFYSKSDTKTPALIAAICLLSGALMGYLLMFPLKHIGLALASSLASILNFCWLTIILFSRDRYFPRKPLFTSIFKYSLMSAFMVAVVYPLSIWAGKGERFFELCYRTMGSVLLGVLIYVILSFIFKVPFVKPLSEKILKKLKLKKI